MTQAAAGFPPLPFALETPDRYLTFQGIDFEGNMKTVLQHLSRYIDDPAHDNAFWDRFKLGSPLPRRTAPPSATSCCCSIPTSITWSSCSRSMTTRLRWPT